MAKPLLFFQPLTMQLDLKPCFNIHVLKRIRGKGGGEWEPRNEPVYSDNINVAMAVNGDLH